MEWYLILWNFTFLTFIGDTEQTFFDTVKLSINEHFNIVRQHSLVFITYSTSTNITYKLMTTNYCFIHFYFILFYYSGWTQYCTSNNIIKLFNFLKRDNMFVCITIYRLYCWYTLPMWMWGRKYNNIVTSSCSKSK